MKVMAAFVSHPTHHWHPLADGRVQCDVCPRHCRLREGQRGLCFVRAREGNAVVLTTYGRSSGFCVDPIEKKPLDHFLPGTAVLSFGTAGCNLACKFCQNWDISTSRTVDTLADAATPEQLAAAAERLGCRSVAFTYNDPVIFLEYAIDTALACRERGIKAVAVTAGYVCPAPRAELFEHLDAANVDLKAFTEEFYEKTCAGTLAPVLETLAYVRHETSCWLELTTLLIPGLNDSDAEIDALTRWVVEHLGPDVPLHFTAFHPDHRLRDRPPTPPSTLARARRIAMANGVHHAYTGNVHNPAGQSTWCHSCGALLIERDGYALGAWNLGPDGRCLGCGEVLRGVFEEQPGTWGAA
jgi:pyruvate formate lyase activating enzyme